MAITDSYGDHDLVILEADDSENMSIGFGMYCRNCRWEVRAHTRITFSEEGWEKLKKLINGRLLSDFKQQVPASCSDAKNSILVRKIMES